MEERWMANACHARNAKDGRTLLVWIFAAHHEVFPGNQKKHLCRLTLDTKPSSSSSAAAAAAAAAASPAQQTHLCCHGPVVVLLLLTENYTRQRGFHKQSTYFANNRGNDNTTKTKTTKRVKPQSEE
jgi:hypothetical protein